MTAGGLVSSVTQVTIAGVAPGGSAGGDLKNWYPNPGVASVGGTSAADLAAGAGLANAATNNNTVSTIVKRDATGNFTANIITAALTGDVTGNCSGSAGSITGNLTGDVTSVGMATTLKTVNSKVLEPFGSSSNVAQITVDAAGRITAASNVAISGFLTNGTAAGGDLGGTLPSPTVTQVNGYSAANVASGATAANAATASNTASKIVLRDGSGSAGFTNVFLHKATVTPSATPTIDVSTGGIQQMTISTNITAMTVTGMTAGQIIIFDFVHDSSTGGFSLPTPNWASNVFGGSATTGSVAIKHNSQMFWSDGINLYAVDQMRTDLG